MQNTTKNITDLARLVLLDVNQIKTNRLQDEQLEKIKGRVQAIMEEYESVRRKENLVITAETENMITLGVVDDYDELDDLLADPGLRSKYCQKLEVFLMKYEQKCEQLELILCQLQDFFIEVQEGDAQQLLEQVTEDEIDLEKVTGALEVALGTAKLSVDKLLCIKEKMDCHLADVTIYPGTNWKRKTRKPLFKAKGEAISFSHNLKNMEEKLQKSTDKCTHLQVQLAEKTQECAKLTGINDELKKFQVSNKAIIKELEAAHGVSRDKLEFGKSDFQNLLSQMEWLVDSHKSKMEIFHAEQEAKSKETQRRFDEQLKSLIEENVSKDIVFEKVAQKDTFLQEDQIKVSPSKDDKISPLTEKTIEHKELKVEFEKMSKQLIQVQNQVSKFQERLSIMEAEKTALMENLQQRGGKGKLQSLVIPQPIQEQQQRSIVTEAGENALTEELQQTEKEEIPSQQSLVTLQDQLPLTSIPMQSQSNRPPVDSEKAYRNLAASLGSRWLPYSSASQTGTVNHDHPIVLEWAKAYESMIKFKDNVISMLVEHKDSKPFLSILIDELKAVKVHTMDKESDVQGQIIEMGLRKALLLHQIEQTFQEFLRQMKSWDPTPAFKTTLPTQKIIDENHKSEIDSYKDAIVKLSMRNKNLQIKLTQLENYLASLTDNGTIMFSRLDLERNTRKLETAVDKKMLSPEDFVSLTKDMKEYLTIPTQRLAALAHRLLDKSAVTKLVKNICKTCVNTRQAAGVLEGIVTMDNKREEKHNMYMEMSAMQRNELAHSLTRDLREAEKEAGETLIKPIFGARDALSRDFITPIPRPLPLNQHHFAHKSPGGSSKYKQMTCSNRQLALQSLMKRTQTASPTLQIQPTQGPTKAKCYIGTTELTPSWSNSTPPCFLHNKSKPRFLSTSHVISPSSTMHKSPVHTRTYWNVRSTQREHYNDSLVPGDPFPKTVELDLARNSLLNIYSSYTSAE